MRFKLAALAFVIYQAAALAQTPATVHFLWNPNPATDLVTQYQVSVDGATPIIVLASTCTTTQCGPIALTIPTFGSHTVVIFAQNLKLSTDPTSLQSGPSSSVPFSLASLPVVVANAKITN